MFGVQGHFQLARQNSGGTPTTIMTSFHPIPFVSENLDTIINPLVSDTLRGRFDEGPTRQGLHTVQGDISVRLIPQIVPVFFYGLTGVISSSALGSGNQHFFVPTQAAGFSDDLALTPWTGEMYKDGQTAHQYTDMQLSRLALEITGGQLVRATGTYMARVSSAKAATTPTFPTGDDFAWNQASVSLGGAGWTNFESVTFTIDNALEFVPLLDGSLHPRRIVRNNYRSCRVTGTVDLPVNSITGLWDTFRRGVEQSLVCTVEGGTAVSSGVFNRFKIDIPTFRYDTFRINVGGPGRVVANFEGRAVYNAGSAMLFLLHSINSWSNY